jgi:protein-tyrosine phosphatase
MSAPGYAMRSMFGKVLIVCHANVCRSPALEQLFRAWQPRRGARAAAPVFGSAGLQAVDGAGMDPVMHRLLGERGVAVCAHRARRLTRDLVRAADLVLVTERRQVRAVERIEPTARGKVYALGTRENADVGDPHGGDEAEYRASLALMERLVKEWLVRIC